MDHRKKYAKRAFAACMGLFLVAQPISAQVTGLRGLNNFEKTAQNEFQQWQRLQSQEKQCQISFPRKPEYLKNSMKMKEDNKELQYDVYVADFNRQEVFMLLIAEYPEQYAVSDEQAKANLEHFLNIMVHQNHKNRLLFADLVTVQGHPALDFHICTDQVYFKGRAIYRNNRLYLIAMESEIVNYQETHFQYFVQSFQFTHAK